MPLDRSSSNKGASARLVECYSRGLGRVFRTPRCQRDGSIVFTRLWISVEPRQDLADGSQKQG
jgi:hypothetical protein